MWKLLKAINSEQRGFTLIELLVVIAILGVIAAIAVPNVGKFIATGTAESYQEELHNVQTGVVAMMADSASGVLDSDYTDVNDLGLVTADSSAIRLSHYMTGLNTDNTVKTGCAYTISQDGGIIHQSTP